MPILTWFGGFYTYGIISYVSTTWPGFISQYFPSWKTLPLFQPYLICLLFVQPSPSPQGWSLISWAPWVFVHMSYHVAYHDMTFMRAQSCPALCNPMDCSLPGSSVYGIILTRILEWVALPLRYMGSPSLSYIITIIISLRAPRWEPQRQNLCDVFFNPY